MSLNAQSFQVAKETLIKFEDANGNSKFSFVGMFEKKPAFLFFNKVSDSLRINIKYFDEASMRFFESGINQMVHNRTYTSFNVLDSYLFYRILVFKSMEDYGYNRLYLEYRNDKIELDSIYNADKKIHSNFSSDGRYLLVNSLNTLSDYYNPDQDDRIMVYDLSDIDQGNIKKEYIPCDKCADSYLVNNTLFFTIGRKDAYGGFNNKDIYMAPWGNLKDTVKIASNTKIIAISPDGKYILGSRFFDRQKNTCVIIDVASKKYQMLLGRDYFKHKAFYSYHEDKFAFDFKGYLIYVDFPESYPFDALKWRNEEIPDWTEKEFWGKYQHDPLSDKN